MSAQPSARDQGLSSAPGQGTAAGAGPVHDRQAALVGETPSCSAARRTTRALLDRWTVTDEQRRGDVLLVVSELVGNALRHAAPPVCLDLLREGATVTVGVSDGSDALPRPRPPHEQGEGGRGLAIVAALSDEWGVEVGPSGGKRVWARVSLPG